MDCVITVAMRGMFFIISFAVIFTVLCTVTFAVTKAIYLLVRMLKIDALKKYSLLFAAIPLTVLFINRIAIILKAKDVNTPGMWIFGGNIPYYNSFQFIFDVEIIISIIILIIALFAIFRLHQKTRNETTT